MKYFGGFDNIDDIKREFFRHTTKYPGNVPEDFPTDDDILFAAYEGGDYEGDAIVVYLKDGVLYEVNGSHCSCYGLEDQWSPEETSLDALKMRKLSSYSYAEETRSAFDTLVGR
jgi:hypothetical protein